MGHHKDRIREEIMHLIATSQPIPPPKTPILNREDLVFQLGIQDMVHSGDYHKNVSNEQIVDRGEMILNMVEEHFIERGLPSIEDLIWKHVATRIVEGKTDIAELWLTEIPIYDRLILLINAAMEGQLEEVITELETKEILDELTLHELLLLANNPDTPEELKEKASQIIGAMARRAPRDPQVQAEIAEVERELEGGQGRVLAGL